VLGLTFLSAAPVSAGTISVSGKITVTAIVAPQHYVIINDSGTITEIISNSNQDTVPLVYKDKVIKGNEMPLTPEIYAQYNKIIKPGKSYIGTIYKQPSAATVINRPYSSQTSNFIVATKLFKIGF
jgi:hypothetical protein